MSSTNRVEAERWPRVTKRNPCPICQQDHYCKVTEDGALAGCMRVKDDSFKTVQTNLGEMYLHRLIDEPREIPSARPKASSAPLRDIMADRAVYALVVQASTELPEVARGELVRRFGPSGLAIAERFRIGYGDGPRLIAAIDAAGRRQDAIAAGVLRRDGSVVPSLLDRLIIPYIRDGLVYDLRGAGIKEISATKELSLTGSYADRGVADLFHNHDALGRIGEDAEIHIAGGAFKTMALDEAGLPAVGLRGEAEFSEGHIAVLREAGVRTIVFHLDAEDPKEGQDLSAGRRLGLMKADRLADSPFVVRMAEPPREPGTPKMDPDSLLRDFGPRLVRAYALSALPVAVWRVAIGVEAVGIPERVQAEMAALRERCAKQGRRLVAVVQSRRNSAIKAERDALTASALHMADAQEAGKVTPEGRIRQPLWHIADSVGKTKPTVSKHLKVGADAGLFRRELLEETIERKVDPESGELRAILRLRDSSGTLIEECPADLVLGSDVAYRRAATDGEEATGAYYVTPLHEPTVILDTLITLNPTRIDKQTGAEKDTWGGKREPCPDCGSHKRRKVVACADCGHEFSNTIEYPPGDTLLPQRDKLLTDTDGNIAPIPVEELAQGNSTYPQAASVDQSGEVELPKVHTSRAPEAPGDDDRDDWDPYECNHRDCTNRIVIGSRYCGQHRDRGLTPPAPRPIPITVGQRDTTAAAPVAHVRHVDPDDFAPPAEDWYEPPSEAPDDEPGADPPLPFVPLRKVQQGGMVEYTR